MIAENSPAPPAKASSIPPGRNFGSVVSATRSGSPRRSAGAAHDLRAGELQAGVQLGQDALAIPAGVGEHPGVLGPEHEDSVEPEQSLGW